MIVVHGRTNSRLLAIYARLLILEPCFLGFGFSVPVYTYAIVWMRLGGYLDGLGGLCRRYASLITAHDHLVMCQGRQERGKKGATPPSCTFHNLDQEHLTSQMVSPFVDDELPRALVRQEMLSRDSECGCCTVHASYKLAGTYLIRTCVGRTAQPKLSSVSDFFSDITQGGECMQNESC